MARLFFLIVLEVALDVAIGSLANYAEALQKDVWAGCGVLGCESIEVVI